jgi:3-oxoacyl-[acyl-carrier-protein] synthase-3
MIYNNIDLASMGYALPHAVISSEDLEEQLAPLYEALHLGAGQLEALTGIRERRWWEPGFTMRQGALAAARQALERAGVRSSQVGMLIYAGVCRDYLEPATACAVAHGLGLGETALVYDVSNACLGVLNGMVQVADAIAAGRVQAGLVVSCESAREVVEAAVRRLNAQPDMELFRETLATLTGGSGAVAVLLTRRGRVSSGHRLAGGAARNAVAHHELCTWSPACGADPDGPGRLRTDAVGVLRHGVELGTATFAALRQRLGWQTESIARIICHQVGAAHQRAILAALAIPAARDFTTYAYLGNIGTVSLPITAAIAAERGHLQPGQRVAWLGIGSGLNCLMLGLEW